MSEELGKIEKPSAAEFKKGRKLFFVPAIYGAKKLPADYLEKLNNYWRQVEDQIYVLESKLGQVNKIFHELILASGEEGLEALKDLNNRSYQITKKRVDNGAQLEETEDAELLTEFMDWSRCLAVGLQNQKVLAKVYESYTEVSKGRNEFIARRIDEALKADEIGVFLMREGYQVQFPSGIEIFYIAPPPLDEIKRWLRDREAQPSSKGKSKGARKGGSQ